MTAFRTTQCGRCPHLAACLSASECLAFPEPPSAFGRRGQIVEVGVYDYASSHIAGATDPIAEWTIAVGHPFEVGIGIPPRCNRCDQPRDAQVHHMFDDRPTYGLAQPRVQGAPTGFNVDLVRDACWPGDIGQTQADAQDHTPSTDTTIPTDHPPTSNPQPGNHPEHAPIGWMPDLTPDHRSPMAKLLDLARAILDRLPIDLIDTDHPTTGNP